MALWKSSPQQYALMAKFIHWLSALTIVGLFFLGLWMTSLDYYHNWYQTAPDLHIAVGFFLFCVTVLRFIYRQIFPFPEPLPAPKWQLIVAHLTHLVFYGLIITMFFTGYFIVTAKGQGLSVWGWFEVPALVTGIDNMEDLMGDIHEWLAYIIIGLAVLHAGAALKHHFWDKDGTLVRMIGRIKR